MLQTRPLPTLSSLRARQSIGKYNVRRQQLCAVSRLMSPVQADVLITDYTDCAGDLMRAATFGRLVSQPDPSDRPADPGTSGSSGRPAGQAEVIEFPQRSGNETDPKKDAPLIRVRLSVHYRVHSRQMLCIGGSQIPFGWSFLSIAKVPMAWNQGDVWTAEVIERVAPGNHEHMSMCCHGLLYVHIVLWSCSAYVIGCCRWNSQQIQR